MTDKQLQTKSFIADDFPTFKATYQDRALRKRTVLFDASSWQSAVPVAFEKKKADEKLLTIEMLEETSDEKTCKS